MSHTESYIDSSVKTPENLPSNIVALLDILSDCDRKGEWWSYFDRLDDLWVNAKNAVAAGVMPKESWEILEKKYWLHADLVYDKEFGNGTV